MPPSAEENRNSLTFRGKYFQRTIHFEVDRFLGRFILVQGLDSHPPTCIVQVKRRGMQREGRGGQRRWEETTETLIGCGRVVLVHGAISFSCTIEEVLGSGTERSQFALVERITRNLCESGYTRSESAVLRLIRIRSTYGKRPRSRRTYGSVDS